MKLKPCPFCGGDAIFSDWWHEETNSEPKLCGAVLCKKCGAHMFSTSDEEADWNRRTDPEKAQMLEALKRVEEITVNTVDADYVELDDGMNDINAIVCDTIKAVEVGE